MYQASMMPVTSLASVFPGDKASVFSGDKASVFSGDKGGVRVALVD
ncbi:hypothetical protein [Novipirellula herctigrandis]